MRILESWAESEQKIMSVEWRPNSVSAGLQETSDRDTASKIPSRVLSPLVDDDVSPLYLCCI
jgi:hypothetical protein